MEWEPDLIGLEGGGPGMEWEPDLIGLEAIQAPGSKKLEGKSGL